MPTYLLKEKALPRITEEMNERVVLTAKPNQAAR
jgi:hypothetical protein